MEDIIKLSAQPRESLGTGAARALRRNNMVPATLYGAGNEPVSVAIQQKEIMKYYQRPQYISQVFEIEVGGKTHKVLPKSIQLHPITDIVSHVDFVFVEKKEQKMAVPIVYLNKENCIGIKRGGYFNRVRRHLNISCPVANLPRKIEMDITNKRIGTTIKAEEFVLPEGATLLDNPKFVIASIIGKKSKDDEPASEAAADKK
jgi:large subunit ribosomal protein L25